MPQRPPAEEESEQVYVFGFPVEHMEDDSVVPLMRNVSVLHCDLEPCDRKRSVVMRTIIVTHEGAAHQHRSRAARYRVTWCQVRQRNLLHAHGQGSHMAPVLGAPWFPFCALLCPSTMPSL